MQIAHRAGRLVRHCSARLRARRRSGWALAASTGRRPSGTASRWKASARDWNSPGGGLTRVSETYGNHSFGSSQASEEWLLGRWEAFLTPNLLAVTQGSVGRTILESAPGDAFGLRADASRPERLGPVAADRGGLALRVHHRQSLALRAGQLSRRAPLPGAGDGGLGARQAAGEGRLRGEPQLRRDQPAAQPDRDLYLLQCGELRLRRAGLCRLSDSRTSSTPFNQHNCDQTGKVWRDSSGKLRGLGYLPCYSYYSQTIGPANWHLSTNDWAGLCDRAVAGRASCCSLRRAALGAGAVAAADCRARPIRILPLTEKLPDLGNNWGPR